ncbi:MAG: BrnT family toxin [Ignavibacteriaceae bacterium]|nr:BrnT family toxin [Ignavibacteriaceae bacterium]
MNNLSFQWDQNKNLENIKKHKVSFDEAKSVFFDDNARLIHDPEHSIDEERFIILGMSSKLKILVVVHVYRENDKVIRIISARKATKSEIKYYYEAK